MRLFGLLLLSALAALGDPNPSKAGLDPERLKAIPVRMKALVDQGVAAGCVTLVARHGVIAELDAVGMADIEAGKPMRTDTIFQIMSMTKPVTAVGIMMLAEEGKLALNESVEKYLPDFRGQSMAGGSMPNRPISVRDLLTHTSGMGSAAPDNMKQLNQRMDHTLAEAVSAYARQHLSFQPGTKWQYSNNGIATLGRIIEVLSGMPYERFITDRILTPLEMKDTSFFLPAEKMGRLALVYKRDNGKLVRAGDSILGGDPTLYRKDAKYPAPEWGLYSTAEDLARFYQMMLNGGTYNGRRYLSRMGVDLMRIVHTGDIAPAGWLPLGGSGYGLAWEVTRDATSQLLFMPAGTYGHGGAFGTQGWIDPKDDLIRVLMMQGSSGTEELRSAFMQIAGSAVID